MKGYVVGIDLYDNDFTETIRVFLKLLSESKFEFDKKQIRFLWTNLCLGIYLVSQNGFEYNWAGVDLDYIKSYLSGEHCNIYIGNEVYDHVNEIYSNGEFAYFEKYSEQEVRFYTI